MKNWGWILGCLLLVWPTIARAETASNIVINELAWAGSKAFGSNDEWIELYNPTDSVVDISGWTLTKKSSGTEKLMLTIPTGKTIPANSYFLISHLAKTNSSLNIDPDLVDSALTLANTTLQIKLYDGAWPGSNLIDTAGDGGAPPAGSNDAIKKSMERKNDGSWQSASEKTNLDTDCSDFGTPKALNSATTITPTTPTTGDSGGSIEKLPSYKIDMNAKDVTDESLKIDWSTIGDNGAKAKTVYLWQTTAIGEKGIKLHTLTPPKGTVLVENLAPNTRYWFYLEIVDVSNQIFLSDLVALTTKLPNPLLTITELLPIPSAITAPFVEIQTTLPSNFFDGWSIHTSRGIFKLERSALQITDNGKLIVFPLPENTINTDGEVIQLLDLAGKPYLQFVISALQPDSSYALAKDGKYYWTNQLTPGKPNVVITSAMLNTTGTAPSLPTTGHSTAWLLILGATTTILSMMSFAIEQWLQK